ncbi:hypothetical protein [Rhabdaerophilum calidifontis]|uniref:hypothetical protein n=1 Tax=Rhabdaerophilum calidifontis TaxID=2604328 RepID=UPI001238685C|nr:hypothetical protein [Rhabdaerophilum calidifontis]
MQNTMTGGPAAVFAMPAARTIVNLMLGGLVGLLVWEIWARVLTKAVLGYPLEPAGLIDALFQHNLGLTVPWLLREALHYAVGIIGYPVAYYLISRLVPRWGLVLDAVVLATFGLAMARLIAAGAFTPLHFMFLTAVLALLASRFINRSPGLADAISWGNFTWFNALGLMAPLGGLSFYLLGEGGDLSYMSFAGHVIYGALAALVFEHRERRAG